MTDEVWVKAHREAVEELKKAGSTGVIFGENETNIGLAERDYTKLCQTEYVTKSGDQNFYGVGGCITMFRGYWFWWCKTHYQPLAWCDKGRLELTLKRVIEAVRKEKKDHYDSEFREFVSRLGLPRHSENRLLEMVNLS